MIFTIRSLLLFTFALLLLGVPRATFAQTVCPQGTSLNIVAHEDDDLLFLSPDILSDIRAGRCLTTVFVTAGDANLGSSYWQSREEGIRAAYAQMAGTSNSWRQSDAGIRNRSLSLYTLSSHSSVAVIFLRLPDGNWDGLGFSNNNFESIKKLWQGNIQSIRTVDGSSSYTKQDLVATLLALMTKYSPNTVRTQNYVDSYNGGDHSDHFTTAYAALEAHAMYLKPHTLIGYLGYATSSRPANLSGNDITSKRNAFFLYASYDPNVCSSVASCQNSPYGAWLERQYPVGSIGPVSNTQSPTPATSPILTPTPTVTPRVSMTLTKTATPTVSPTIPQLPRPTRSITFPFRPTISIRFEI